MIENYEHGCSFDRRTGKTQFRVWAPSKAVRLAIFNSEKVPQLSDMQKNSDGFYFLEVQDAPPGTLYKFEVDGELRPDPASRFQPEGVHGPSAVTALNFEWKPLAWQGLPLKDHIIYELHVGTFSAEHDFSGVINNLEHLLDLGITAIEIMPISQFPGSRNWGYDGAYLYAVQNSYGGPTGLKQLVEACHEKGLAVILDVVYNHFGPEGNYLHSYGPYFTDKYQTPWGKAINFDGAGAIWVRRFFLENVYYWLSEFRIDGLRLDAVHAIFDESATHILEEMQNVASAVGRKQNRQIHLIAETDLNNPRIIKPVSVGGYGLSAQWSDDFHHSIHAKVTGENTGYYSDYGKTEDIVKVFQSGYVYEGQYSKYRDRQQGRSTDGLSSEKFVVCSQNHDQVGNRMLGDRLSGRLDTQQLKLLAASVLLSPFTPLLFMGEEYAEDQPFPYFISHTDPDLVRAVQAGRKNEFKSFAWKAEPPDPQAEKTFESAVLKLQKKLDGVHHEVFSFYKSLTKLRKTLVKKDLIPKRNSWTRKQGDLVSFTNENREGVQYTAFLNFSNQDIEVEVPDLSESSTVLLSSAAALQTGQIHMSGYGVLVLSNLKEEVIYG